MSLSVTRTKVEGFEGIHVQTGVIELTLLPELGGKICSLRDIRNGREWLWRHPRFPYRKVPHGSSYVEASDTGGWDECFPSVSACSYPSEPWKGAAIQDHGELWNQTATIDVLEQPGGVKLHNSWQGVALPYIFSRVITLQSDSPVVHVEYEAANKVDQPINFVWSIHPLLAIEPGMELHLPDSAQFNVAGTFPPDLISSGEKLRYPFEADGLKLELLPERDAGRAIKIWSDPLSSGEGWAAVRARDGQLKMRWDPESLTQVGAWMNFGAWAADGGTPYYNLGLEPCIGAQDSLEEAVNRYNLFVTLPPHGSKSWWLEIELTG